MNDTIILLKCQDLCAKILDMECIFCQIVKGEIKAKIVFEDKDVMAIEDINPKAKYHILVFPKEHISNSIDDEKSDKELVPIFNAIRVVARKYGLEKSGYRVVTNHGEDAGQSVQHLHFHLLGGEKLE